MMMKVSVCQKSVVVTNASSQKMNARGAVGIQGRVAKGLFTRHPTSSMKMVKGGSGSSAVHAASSPEQEKREYEEKYPAWDSIQYQLVNTYKLSTVSPEEAKAMMESEQVLLVDVRPQQSHSKYRPEGSVNVPAFRIIEVGQGGGITSVMKFAVMKFNGVTPTEANPDFPTLAKEIAGSSKKLILACEQGGSLTPTTTFPTGKVSRSLKAAWRLIFNEALEAERVLHLDGGIKGWVQAGLPMIDERD